MTRSDVEAIFLSVLIVAPLVVWCSYSCTERNRRHEFMMDCIKDRTLIECEQQFKDIKR